MHIYSIWVSLFGTLLAIFIYYFAKKRGLGEETRVLLAFFLSVLLISTPQLILTNAIAYYPYVELGIGDVLDSVTTYLHSPALVIIDIVHSLLCCAFGAIVTSLLFSTINESYEKIFKEKIKSRYALGGKCALVFMSIVLTIMVLVVNSTKRYALTIESGQPIAEAYFKACPEAVVMGQFDFSDDDYGDTTSLSLDCLGKNKHEAFKGVSESWGRYKNLAFQSKYEFPFSVAFRPIVDKDGELELILTYGIFDTPPPKNIAKVREVWANLLPDLFESLRRKIDKRLEDDNRISGWEEAEL